MLWLRGAPGAVPVQRRDVSDVQLLPEHQELLGDQDHLRLHLAAGDHRRLRHAVAGCGRAAEKGTSGLRRYRKCIRRADGFIHSVILSVMQCTHMLCTVLLSDELAGISAQRSVATSWPCTDSVP